MSEPRHGNIRYLNIIERDEQDWLKQMQQLGDDVNHRLTAQDIATGRRMLPSEVEEADRAEENIRAYRRAFYNTMIDGYEARRKKEQLRTVLVLAMAAIFLAVAIVSLILR
jgi:hypothetical protein